MLKTIIERTSCRSYLKQSIPHEKIAQLKQAINASPTARNLQDFSCIFITDETIRQKLSVFANQQLHVKEAPLFLIFIADQNRPNSLTKWTEVDSIIAASTALYAAESIGLQTCLIGRIVEYEAEIKTLLNIQGNVKITIGLTVGFPKTKTPQSAKLNRCYDEKYNIALVQQGK